MTMPCSITQQPPGDTPPQHKQTYGLSLPEFEEAVANTDALAREDAMYALRIAERSKYSEELSIALGKAFDESPSLKEAWTKYARYLAVYDCNDYGNHEERASAIRDFVQRIEIRDARQRRQASLNATFRDVR